MDAKSTVVTIEFIPEHWEPAPYQMRAVEFMVKHSVAGLWLEPGLRKTSITLKTLQILKKTGQIHSTLVIAPLRVCWMVWPNEIKRWTEFNNISYAVLHGTPKFRMEAIEEGGKDLYIINPDGLEWLLKDKSILRKLNIDTLVVDEVSGFKHTNTKRFKLLKPFLHLFRRRYTLTGTPNTNGMLDLFGQLYILDEGNALGRWYTHYRSQYFYSIDSMGWNWKLFPGAEEQIYERLKPLILRLDEKDYLALPEAIEDQIEIELPEKVRKVYDLMEDELITQIKEKTIIAANAGVAIGKCSQICNGALYYFENHLPKQLEQFKLPDRKTLELHNAKIEALEELVEELQGQSLFVAYEYSHDFERIARALFPKMKLTEVPVIKGGTSPKRSAELADLWNAGKLPILIGQPAAMGHGLNLQNGGCHICWFSVPFDLELYDQTNRRFRRSGSPHAQIFIYHLVARNTVDIVKLRTLKKKNTAQQSLLDALKTYIKDKKCLEVYPGKN